MFAMELCYKFAKMLSSARQVFLDIMVTLLLIMSEVLLYKFGRPVRRGFFCDDASIKYPYKGETIPGTLFTVVTFVAPGVIIFLTEIVKNTKILCTKTQHPDPAHLREKAHFRPGIHAYIVFIYGYVINNLFVMILKLSTGKLRPNFLDTCKPDLDIMNCTGFVTHYVCTNTDVKVNTLSQANQSFPSGHASTSVFCAVFLALYLEFRVNTQHWVLSKLTLQVGLLLVGLWSGATRISDFMHDWTDVACGTVIGLLLAILVFYRACYPAMQLDTSPKLRPMKCKPEETCVCMEPDTPTLLLEKIDNEIIHKDGLVN